MSAVPVSTGRCWILSHSLDGEWIPHYSSEIEALHALACEWNEERDDFLRWADKADEVGFEEEYSHLVASEAVEESDPCCRMVCDGCGFALGRDGEMVDAEHGSHIRADEFDHVLDAEEWGVGEGGDFCPACPPPESEEEAGRRPGPLDVPLPFEGVRRCRVCGCTDDHACPAGCSWVAEDLCSACPVAP